MGAFIGIYSDGCQIIKGKEEEFKERIKHLFYAGGMMDCVYIPWKNDRYITLLKEMGKEDDCLMFDYNYFEDSQWETAGFNEKDLKVFSNKVGNSIFSFVMIAAYTLQSLYSDGDVFVKKDDMPLQLEVALSVGWINYLFHEEYCFHTWDRFKGFLLSGDRDYVTCDYHIYFTVDSMGIYPIISNYELMILKKGLDNIVKELSYDGKTSRVCMFFYILEQIKPIIMSYKEQSKEKESEQIKKLINIVNQFIEDNDLFKKELHSDEELIQLKVFIQMMDSPVITLKAISEVYDVDFWNLYDQIKNCHRVYEKDDELLTVPIEKITTSDFLNKDIDQFIYFYKNDGKIQFTKELEDWFQELKCQFERIMNGEKITPYNTMDWVMDIILYANDHYGRIYPFESFVFETLSSSDNEKYIALWQLLNDMCHDPQMLEMGKVIFEDDNCGYKYYNEKRHEFSGWSMIPRDKKFNEARQKIRRYLALVANKELRKHVFGF
ncbi:MAG: hypothetical protein ACLUVC_09570 [Longibaculum sp.]